ncbi:MAG: YoaK family protein [Candidatus Heritagella sp.]
MKTERNSSTPVTESFGCGCLLALAGGVLETYSFIVRGGVFANAQTGNMALLAVRLLEGDLHNALRYFIPVFSFFLGVLLSNLLRVKTRSRLFQWQHFVLLLEIFLLLAVGFLPHHEIADFLATTLISFSCSLQVEAFRKVEGAVYATTMCTGNLRSGTAHLFTYLHTRDKDHGRRAAQYFSIIFLFMLGCAIGAAGSLWGREKAIWISCALLLGVFFLLFRRPASPDREEVGVSSR